MPRYKSILNTASFIVFGSVLVVILLAPMDLTPTLRMPPDFLFCFIFVFLVRDPQNVPVLSVIFVSLLADFLWFRPIGLTTLIILLASKRHCLYLRFERFYSNTGFGRLCFMD